MKTTLKFLTILTVILMLAGGIYLLVANTDVVSSLLPSVGPGGERPEKPTMIVDGEMPARTEGGDDHNAASFSRGMAGVAQSLAKIGVISLVVLLVQAAFGFIKKQRRPKPSLG